MSHPARGTAGLVLEALRSGARVATGNVRDVAPIVGVVAFFQLVVLREPFPDLATVVVGMGAVLLGLALFIRGLELALFPLGESMAQSFARKGSVAWLLAFAFALGFGTTIAEPALLAVAGEAARARAEADGSAVASDTYALALRYTVATAVGVALVIGVLRILRGWRIERLLIGGYLLVVLLTRIAPDDAVGIAYDSGGVTTSTITVPLVAALGIGLSLSLKGRSPMTDGFGLIAFASLTPILFVLVLGMVT